MRGFCLFLAALAIQGIAQAQDRVACAREVGEQLPTDDPGLGWHFPSRALASIQDAIIHHTDPPVVAEGDFDGDNKPDVAYLIETDAAKTLMVAVCLSSTPKVQFITDLACMRTIGTRSKKQWHYKHDAIGSQCSDYTGMRLEFSKGVFQRIMDSGDPDMP